MTNQQIADERGLTVNFETGTYYDQDGNEYRDENGECLKLIPETAEEARQAAIDWQNWVADRSISWGEVAVRAEYFEILANKFNLVDEFQENGII